MEKDRRKLIKWTMFKRMMKNLPLDWISLSSIDCKIKKKIIKQTGVVIPKHTSGD